VRGSFRSAHDVGTGAFTVIAQTAAERLGVAPGDVPIVMGDSTLPPAPVAGGSVTTASACNAVARACEAVRAKLFRAVVAKAEKGGKSPLVGVKLSALDLSGGKVVDGSGKSMPLDAAFDRLGSAAIEEYAEWVPHGAKPGSMAKIYAGSTDIVGGAGEDRLSFAHGAEFVVVKVHRLAGEIRVSRIVGAFAAGHIVNPRAARSQLKGGMIWGISSALHEATELDRRVGRYVNTNLADYLVPVNADIQELEVILVPEEDRLVNPLGIKGLGELGNVGTNAAIANAVYQATGRRPRTLPIRIEDVI
jgi:xanthine dehydrogenase YagR molybdenum-binding subunit